MGVIVGMGVIGLGSWWGRSAPLANGCARILEARVRVSKRTRQLPASRRRPESRPGSPRCESGGPGCLQRGPKRPPYSAAAECRIPPRGVIH